MPFQVKYASGFGQNQQIFSTATAALKAVGEAEEDNRENIEVFELGGKKISLTDLSALAKLD